MPPIRFVEPIERAWQRMVEILFRPFSLEKWLVIGFAAWLAGLASGGGGSGAAFQGGGGSGGGDSSSLSLGLDAVPASSTVGSALARGPVEAFEALEELPAWSPLVVGCVLILIAVVMAIVVLLLWLSSRGIFVFLDDVIHDRARIKEPWSRYARQGDSLFLWRLGLIVVVVAAVSLLILLGLALASAVTPWLLLLWAPLLLIVIFGVVYVDVYLRHFVAPIMYRHALSTNAAWGRFLAIFRERPLPLLVYPLLLLALWIVIGLGILVAGFLTCCIGFILLAIPYVGTVVLLPVLVFFRLLSLEFLRQFGPEVDLLSPVEPAPETP